MQWFGIAIALLFWVVESAIDAFIFREPTFFQRLTAPDANEAWMRFFIVSIIIAFGFFAQRAFKREEKADAKSLENSENRFRDVMEQNQIEKLERLSSIVFENITEAIMVTDAEGHILSVNPAYTEISGYSEEEVIGKNPRVFQSGKHDHDFFKKMWGTLNVTGHWEGEIWDRRKNGESYPKWLSITEVKDENGVIIQYTGLFTDITERKKQEEDLYHRANYDYLTGLVKRALFLKNLTEAVETAVSNQCKAAVFFIDLDKFKRVNDSMGHSVGDELLKVAANRLGSCIRGNDVLARSGGDEFMIVLADIFDHEEIVIVAERILDKFSRPFHLTGEDVFVGTSIGIAVTPEDGKEVVELINKADKAMYQVKTSGGNNFLFHSKEGIALDSRIA